MEIKQYTLKKDERLYLRNDIKELFNSRKSFTIFPFKIIYKEVETESTYPAKILFSVPKRFIKKAVNRNLIKRRTKEAYRKNKHLLYDFLTNKNIKLNIAIIYLNKEIEDYTNIENKIILTLQRIIQKNE